METNKVIKPKEKEEKKTAILTSNSETQDIL